MGPAVTEISARHITQRPPPDSPFNRLFTFERFATGRATSSPSLPPRRWHNAGQSYNPLVIYSDVGLGKTHLLHAIG